MVECRLFHRQKLNCQSVKYSESISLQQLGRATSRQQEYTQHIHDWIRQFNEQLTVILDQLLLRLFKHMHYLTP